MVKILPVVSFKSQKYILESNSYEWLNKGQLHSYYSLGVEPKEHIIYNFCSDVYFRASERVYYKMNK